MLKILNVVSLNVVSHLSSASFMFNETPNLVEESKISQNWTAGFEINTCYNKSNNNAIVSRPQVLLKSLPSEGKFI